MADEGQMLYWCSGCQQARTKAPCAFCHSDRVHPIPQGDYALLARCVMLRAAMAELQAELRYLESIHHGRQQAGWTTAAYVKPRAEG